MTALLEPSAPTLERPAPLRADLQTTKDLPPIHVPDGGYKTVYADPPWRFANRTGKVAPEHRRLDRYDTMTLDDICNLPVSEAVANDSHLYLWVPNALLPEGLKVMGAWGFRYVSNIVWAKRRKDGGTGRPGRWLLLPQRHGARPVRRARQHAHPRPRSAPGEHGRDPQARALP